MPRLELILLPLASAGGYNAQRLLSVLRRSPAVDPSQSTTPGPEILIQFRTITDVRHHTCPDPTPIR